MKALSDTELVIAEWYCHGLTDKEIADVLEKPVWTIRTHKKHIYTKLGISTTHELVLYMVSRHFEKDWDLGEVRRRGLAAVLCMLMIVHILLQKTRFSVVCQDEQELSVSSGGQKNEERTEYNGYGAEVQLHTEEDGRLEFLLDYGKEDCRWRETTDAANGGRKGARL